MGLAHITRHEAEMRLNSLRETLAIGEETLWACTSSPIEVCLYDTSTDPGYYDRCLFCGQPMERK